MLSVWGGRIGALTSLFWWLFVGFGVCILVVGVLLFAVVICWLFGGFLDLIWCGWQVLGLAAFGCVVWLLCSLGSVIICVGLLVSFGC